MTSSTHPCPMGEPSSQFPMSENACTLWCLIDGEDRPFPIRAGRNWEVGTLPYSILSSKRSLQATIEDILLWKVIKPASIDPEDCFGDRFPCPVLDFSDNSIVTRLALTSLVSNIFPGPPDQLHIVVQVKQPALERSPKRQKLDGDEGKVAFSRLLIASTANPVQSGLWTLWEKTWNRKEEAIPWFSLRETEKDANSVVDVPEYCWVFSPPEDVAVEMWLDLGTILFRDDYLRVFSQLFASSGLGNFTPNLVRTPGATFPNFFSGVVVPQDTPKNAFILTGNPGIGKSICLRIILVLRLCARLPTFYQVTPDSTIFFSGRGPVAFVPNSSKLHICLRKEPSAWALFDSTPSFKQPPDVFLINRNFIVQTPPPRTDRMKWQSKFPPVFVFCLDLWTPAELICAAPFQRRRLSEQTLIEFCDKYGYSARDAYAHASEADEFEMSLRGYCRDLSYEKAVKIISDVQKLHFPDDVKHNILCITPTDVDLRFTFDFASGHVYQCVLESLRESEAGVAAKFYRLFLQNGKTKAAAGHMLEAAARDILGDGGSFDILRLEASHPSTYFHWKTPQILSNEVQTRLHITSSGISVGAVRGSPLGRPPIFEYGNGSQLDHFGFYCPTSKNQATFDYLVYDPVEKHVWVFQVTTSPTHTVKEKGIKELCELGVAKVSYVAITPDSPATIDLPFSEYLNNIVIHKYQLRLQ